jgi:hypothetical protein
MFVTNGHGLIAVIRPSKKAVTHGKELLSRRFVRKSIIEIFEWATQKKDRLYEPDYCFIRGSIFDFITSVNFCG